MSAKLNPEALRPTGVYIQDVLDVASRSNSSSLLQKKRKKKEKKIQKLLKPGHICHNHTAWVPPVSEPRAQTDLHLHPRKTYLSVKISNNTTVLEATVLFKMKDGIIEGLRKISPRLLL